MFKSDTFRKDIDFKRLILEREDKFITHFVPLVLLTFFEQFGSEK